MDETIKSIIVQFPMVAVILAFMVWQTREHKASTVYYRETIDFLVKWILENCAGPDSTIELKDNSL